MLKRQWIQKNDGSIAPVSISIIPKYDLNEGLKLVGIINSLKKHEIFEKELNVHTVFGILADVNQKVIHLSENCIENLRFSSTLN